MRIGKIVGVLIVLALAAGTGYRVYRLVTEKKSGVAEPEAPAVIVKAAAVEKGTVRKEISLTGDVEAMSSVQVFPKVSGRLIEPTEKDFETLRKLYEQKVVSGPAPEKIIEVDEGDHVETEQIIAVIDHESVEAQVDQADAALKTARAELTRTQVNLSQTEKDLERFRNLLEKGGNITKQAVEKAEAQYKSLVEQENVAKAAVENSQASLNLALIQLAECYIRAPIAGIISEKFLDPGDMAMVSRPIFAIIDIDKVKVVADLPERYMGQVRNGAGTSIEVDAFPGRAFEGTVTRISPTVNVVNRTAELEIMVQNMDHLLKPGMFARIALNIARREGVPVILEAAVLREEAGEHVFVVEEVVRPRRVRLGRKKGSAVEVLDGVRAGEVLGVLKEEGIGEGAGREFPPEMFERFKVSTPEGGEAPLIPEAAVVRGRSGDYVFAFEGIAHRRKVTLGLEEGPRVEVSEGLEAGELLVVAGQQKLRDGQGVLILQ